MAGGTPIPEGGGGALPLYELLGLLPEIRALAPLREALLAVSTSDEAHRWARGRGYETLDERVLDAERIGRAVRAAAREEAEATDRLFTSVGRALEHRARGHPREAVEVLLEAGVALSDAERFYEARALLEVALRELAGFGDAPLEAETTRRLAKACWRIGALDRAAHLYQRAAELLFQLGRRNDRIVALQGLGNVRAAQGRWDEAEASHRAALDLCAEEEHLLRGQVFNNMSQVTRRRGALHDAREWQERAEAVWSELDVPAERLVAHNNRGLLHLQAGELEEAREALLQGLGVATQDLQRAVLLTNLAQVALRAGRPGDAEHLAREAEAFAIFAGATDVLIEAYTVLGCAGRDGEDPNCVAFFEKALELAADGRFPLAQARAHLEYARYRAGEGDPEEAAAHLRRALEICDATGDTPERRQVLAALEEL